MLFDVQTAKKLSVLNNKDIEQAILLLLSSILREKEEIFSNPQATDADLRAFQGQRMLINELKDYKLRLNDAIKRDKDGPGPD